MVEQQKPSEPAREPSEVLPSDGADGASPSVDDGEAESPRFNLEVAAENVSEALQKLRTGVQYWADRGRYNKIRIKRNGKPVVPDIPVGALVALEAATFFWSGLLRGVIVNVVGRVFFEVELINEADEHYKRGLEHFLAGDIAEAENALIAALKIDDRFARAHLQLGVIRKIQGRREEAIASFENAIAFDDKSEARREAEVHLKRMREGK
jgi:tetratricopeptide (TPR) repeat protein